MIWADRIALTVAAMIAIVAALSSTVLFIGVGTFTDVRLNAAMLLWSAIIEMTVAVPIWVVLRLIDLLSGGRQRRLNRLRRNGSDLREPQAREFTTAGD